jgi:Zn-dependent protease
MSTSYFSEAINQLGFDFPAFILVIAVQQLSYFITARKLLTGSGKEPETFSLINSFDLFGILLPVALVFSSYPIVFGWGKQPEADFSKSASPKSCQIMFGLSGIIGNLILCMVSGLFISLIPKFEFLFSFTSSTAGIFIFTFIFRVFSISLATSLINFLPVPPFAGAKVFFAFFGEKHKALQNKLQILGLLIIVTLILTGIAQIIFIPPFRHITKLLCGGFSAYVLSPGSLAKDFLTL